MALKEDLKNKVDSYFRDPFKVEKTTVVPSTDYSKLTFGNKGLTSELAFLFVDVRRSSSIHSLYGYANAARIYQSFHDICVRIIAKFDGEIRSFDGDRVMGVFSGGSKCTNAVKSAMKIRSTITDLLNKKISPPIRIGCGIDFGETLITKVGKGRNINNHDLVWLGQACNYAAHLSNEGGDSIVISERTYNRMGAQTKWKNSETKTENMWKYKNITLKGGKEVKVLESIWTWDL